MVALIKKFFLEPEIPDEKKNEIDDWMRESKVNDQLFDLLCEASHNAPKSFEKIFRMIERMMEQKGRNRADQIKQSEALL